MDDLITSQIVKPICVASCIIFSVLIIGASTCSVIVAPETTKQAESVNQLQRQQIEAERTRQQAIKELINDGVDPIIARCAVMGWNPNDSVVCATRGMTSNHGEPAR